MRRSRNPVLWFVYGALTGPIAAGILAIAPPGRCPECDSAIAGWPGTCAACGAPLSRIALGRAVSPATAPAPAVPPAAASSAVVGSPAVASSPMATASTILAAPAPSSGNGWDPMAAGPARGGVPVSGSAPTRDTALPTASAATSLRTRAPGTRPGSGSGRGQRGVPPPAEHVLATGIYLSGNAGMTIGALYAVARVDDRIRVFGPVDVGDLSVRLERPLADTEVGAIDDRIIISSQAGRSTTSIVLRAVGGKRGKELEAALGPTAAATGPHG